MDAFAILGFVFGMSGLSLAIVANTAVAKNKAELDELRKRLEELAPKAGV